MNFKHPAFAPYQHEITALGLGRDFPDLNALNALADQRQLINTEKLPLRFTTPNRHFSARDYEHHIQQRGCVPTRIDNWHDVMNALVWLRFPLFKAALNAAHGAAMAAETSTLRGRRRDALTALDESGVWVIADDASLTTLLAQRQWRALFWEQRARVLGHMQFIVVGHALLEKMLQPYPALTGKCLMLESPEPILNSVHLNQIQTQAQLALEDLHTPHFLVPLPLLGIPGWDESNAHPAYYDNASIFRHGIMNSA